MSDPSDTMDPGSGNGDWKSHRLKGMSDRRRLEKSLGKLGEAAASIKNDLVSTQGHISQLKASVLAMVDSDSKIEERLSTIEKANSSAAVRTAALGTTSGAGIVGIIELVRLWFGA